MKGEDVMTTAKKETLKTGNGTSKDTTAKTGKFPKTSSSGAGCGDTIVGIERIADALGVKSISTAQTYVQIYGLPAVKNSASVWELDLEKFQAWARDIGWTKKMHESELRNRIHRKNLEAAGPGAEIKGSINILEKRLQKSMTTIFSLMRDHGEACPIRKLPDGQYRVFENEWTLFLMDIQPARRSKWETEQC
jgi:hypothetical protein